MEIAHLTVEEQQTLHQFEEKLGMVLVAYQSDSTTSKESSSHNKTNESLTSSSM